jgi:hypothetical protein
MMCRSKISLNLRVLAVITRATCCMYQAPGRLGIGGSYIYSFSNLPPGRRTGLIMSPGQKSLCMHAIAPGAERA